MAEGLDEFMCRREEFAGFASDCLASSISPRKKIRFPIGRWRLQPKPPEIEAAAELKLVLRVTESPSIDGKR